MARQSKPKYGTLLARNATVPLLLRMRCLQYPLLVRLGRKIALRLNLDRVLFIQVLSRCRWRTTCIRHCKACDVRERYKMVEGAARSRRFQHCYYVGW